MSKIGKRKKRIPCTMDTHQAAQIEREAKQEGKSIGGYICELAFMGREVYYDRDVVADRNGG